MDKNFKGYRQRQIRLADKEWEKLKALKIKSAKTWNNFIKEVIHSMPT